MNFSDERWMLLALYGVCAIVLAVALFKARHVRASPLRRPALWQEYQLWPRVAIVTVGLPFVFGWFGWPYDGVGVGDFVTDAVFVFVAVLLLPSPQQRADHRAVADARKPFTVAQLYRLLQWHLKEMKNNDHVVVSITPRSVVEQTLSVDGRMLPLFLPTDGLEVLRLIASWNGDVVWPPSTLHDTLGELIGLNVKAKLGNRFMELIWSTEAHKFGLTAVEEPPHFH